MSYQLKFIQDCIAVIGLLFLLSAAHLYQHEKHKGNLLTFKHVMIHTYYTIINRVSTFLLTTGKALEEFDKEYDIQNTSHRSSVISHKTSSEQLYKKKIQALCKQVTFIKEMIATDTLLSLHEKNILSELAKECETKLEHLSHFIKKSLIEHTLPNEAINEHSVKLFESYVEKKISSIAENVLHLTVLSYKTFTSKEYDVSHCATTQDILVTLLNINERLKAFIV